MRVRIVCFLLIVVFVSSVEGQNIWSLDQCISHALDNNINYKIETLQSKQLETNKKQALLNSLPTMSGGISSGYNWGQSIDPFTNQFASTRVQTANIYVGSNWVLFSGLERYHLQKRASSEYMYQQFNNEVEARNIKINVTNYYFQLLLLNEQQKILETQFELSKKQYERIRLIVSEGQATTIDLFQLEAQKAKDSLEVLRVKNSFQLKEIEFKRYLNLSDSVDILLDNPSQINLKNEFSEDISKATEYNLVNQKMDIASRNQKMIYSRLYPTLSLNLSLGSGYSGNNREYLDTDNFRIKPLSNQLQENFYQSASLSLSIPLFNKGSFYTELSKSKVELEKVKLQNEQLKLELNTKIDQLNIDIQNLKAQVEVAKLVILSNEKSFELSELKFEEGYIDLTKYQEVKNQLFKAQSELLQAEIELKVKQLVLGYYFE